jgi:alkylation response protein AidB-like acyl-CoA dehydrogenase
LRDVTLSRDQAPRNVLSRPGLESFLEELYTGRLRWDLLDPFPLQDDEDRRTGDDAAAGLERLLRERVDPTEVDLRAEPPEGLLDELRSRGYGRLGIDPELGGLGLSPLNVFRLLELAASWSPPVALLLAIQAGFGAGAYLPVLPDGPLRDLVRRRVAEGAIFADADTEPTGASNRLRTTVATPAEDGEAYLLTGEKICIGNGPVADFLAVSATVREDGHEGVRIFFVDGDSPRLRVTSRHEFMGLKGAFNSSLALEGVRVPRERMLVGPDDEWRLSPELSAISARARVYVVGAPALAIAKLCLHWAREFVRRRSVDGRGLGSYDQIQRLVATSLAEVFAVESVIEWSLLGGRDGAVNVAFEQSAVKNLSSVTCWRIVDRTMSLLAAEGYETAPSKARRGAQPIPLERVFRDARALRIAGGVDFQVDSWAAERLLTYYYPPPDEEPPTAVPECPRLSARNQEHLRVVAEEVQALAATCSRLSRRHPDVQELHAQEDVAGSLNRIADELFAMSAALARAARLAEAEPAVQELADVYCTSAAERLAALRRRVAEREEPDYAGLSGAWLAEDRLRFLLRDVVARP